MQDLPRIPRWPGYGGRAESGRYRGRAEPGHHGGPGGARGRRGCWWPGRTGETRFWGRTRDNPAPAPSIRDIFLLPIVASKRLIAYMQL